MEDDFSISDMERRKKELLSILSRDSGNRDSIRKSAKDRTDLEMDTRGSDDENMSELKSESVKGNNFCDSSQNRSSTLREYSEDLEGFEFGYWIDVFWEKRKVVTTITLGVFMLAFLLSLIKTPVYEARSKLLNRKDRVEIVIQNHRRPDFYTHDYSYLTIKKMMTTLPLLREVVEDLSLDISPHELCSQVRVEADEDSDVVEIVVNQPKSDKASDIANQLARCFIKKDKGLRRKLAENSYQYLKTETDKVRDQLEKIEEELVEFSNRYGVVDLTIETKLLLNRLAELEKNTEQAETELGGCSARIRELRKAWENQSERELLRITDEKPLQKELVRLEIELADASSKFTEESPAVGNLRENIAKIKGLIKQDLEKKTQIRSYTLNATKKKLFENIIITESEKIAYMAKLKALKSAKADIEERIRTLPQLEKQYALLKRKRDKAEEMYNLLSKSAEEARLASEKTTSNFELIELSENAVKILPKTGLNCILGLIIGIALSLVTVILTEFNDKSLRTPSQLKRYLPFELIETLPLLKARPQELLDVRENEYLMRKFQFISSSIYGQETLMR